MITVHIIFCNVYGEHYATYFTEEHKILPVMVPIKDVKHNKLLFLEKDSDRGYINNIKPFESNEFFLPLHDDDYDIFKPLLDEGINIILENRIQK